MDHDSTTMTDLPAVYRELLASNEGDILVKLKDGKQLWIISFLIKKRSPVFKSMMESSMKEAATGVVDLSSEYSLEAFREFMAYIYYNKLYTGSYVPLLFEILCITEYYDVVAYKSYIRERIIKLVTNEPIRLVIASEALKHGALTSEIYACCLGYLANIGQPQTQTQVCYDQTSRDTVAWCCSHYSTKNRSMYGDSYSYRVDGKEACIYSTVFGNDRSSSRTSKYTARCCLHGANSKKQSPPMSDQLPDFIVDDVNSCRIDSTIECSY